MTTSAPSPAQLAILAELSGHLEPGTYLAGGVAVALELHHRTSLDIDLFVPQDFDPPALFERLVQAAPDAILTGEARGTLHLEVHGIPVSVIAYRYPMVGPPRTLAGVAVPVASTADLVCMKLAAIGGRGATKDFWDLDELLRAGAADGTLASALDLFQRKYPSRDLAHVVKALAYFGDADAAPLPVGLTPEHWARLKERTLERVRAL